MVNTNYVSLPASQGDLTATISINQYFCAAVSDYTVANVHLVSLLIVEMGVAASG